MAKIGRPTKPYHPSWGGDPIAGLTRQKDGRWRIIATGERFSESDERRAIQKFQDWKSRQQDETMDVPLATAVLGDGESVRQAVALWPSPRKTSINSRDAAPSCPRRYWTKSQSRSPLARCA